MRPSQARFVTACQQVLALGVVLAVLTPTAGVISLDVVTRPGVPSAQVVGERPSLDKDPSSPDVAPPADVPGDPAQAERVETAPVEAKVREVPMREQPAPRGRRTGAGKGAVVTSSPEQVEGFGAVGVTWSPETPVEDDQITVRVRTRTGEEWSDWAEVEYHDEHAPDPGSPEAAKARPGTDPLIIGEVDEVEAEAVTEAGVAAPTDMQLAVVEPGEGTSTEVAEPEIDTEDLEGTDGDAEDAVSLMSGAASSTTPRPRIFSRAQWGADERLRDKGSLRYFEVHAGFVHHTVNANGYSRSQVPGIIRSIYAYHTRTRGWSDIGYNFLVDRFGRIWEGRYGGVDRPVVGAHTAGYNDYAFAMSAIGNFETVQPSTKMLNAYGRLFAWKLALHGVDATAPSQRVGSRSFPAINGHRDAGSTACPGRYLYAKLSTIRELASEYQADWSGRDRQTDLAGSAYPDLLVRKAGSQVSYLLPTEGILGFKKRQRFGRGYAHFDTVELSPDLTGDGRNDVFVRNEDGKAGVRPGTGSRFKRLVKPTRAFAGLDQITPVGDLDGNGHNDLVARDPQSGRLHLFSGDGAGGFSRSLLSRAWGEYDMTIGVGDFNQDGKTDVLARSGDRLWLHRGTGGKALQDRIPVNGDHWGQWDQITGFGDYSGDGKADLYVRSAKGTGSIYLGRKGRKVHAKPLGPFGRVRGLAHLSGGPITGSDDSDLVGVRKGAIFVIPHTGTYNTGRKIKLGTVFAGADTVLNVGDWNGDGHGDVVSRRDGRLRLHPGQEGSGFAEPVDLGGGWGTVQLLEAVGDVTGDGFPDLMGQPAGSAMRIYPGNGATGLKASYVSHSAVSASRQLGIGRWDEDGSPDSAFRVGDRIRWYRGNGPGGLTGGFAAINSIDLSPYDWVLSVGNIDGGGKSDLVVRRKGTGHLYLLRGTASGFKPPKFLVGGVKNYDLAG